MSNQPRNNKNRRKNRRKPGPQTQTQDQDQDPTRVDSLDTQNESEPLRSDSDSKNVDDSATASIPGPSDHSGETDSPIYERMTSTIPTASLQKANDNLSVSQSESAQQGRRASIADVISSIAKNSATHTDDVILRRDSNAGNNPPPAAVAEAIETSGHAGPFEEDEEENEEDQEENQEDQDQEDQEQEDKVEPASHGHFHSDSSFERSIIENKLTIDTPKPQLSPHQDRSVEPLVSPFSKEGTVDGYDFENHQEEGAPVHDPSSFLQDEPEAEESHDPITLVEDKRASELQEYVPEAKEENDDEVHDYEPSQEQLKPLEDFDTVQEHIEPQNQDHSGHNVAQVQEPLEDHGNNDIHENHGDTYDEDHEHAEPVHYEQPRESTHYENQDNDHSHLEYSHPHDVHFNHHEQFEDEYEQDDPEQQLNAYQDEDIEVGYRGEEFHNDYTGRNQYQNTEGQQSIYQEKEIYNQEDSQKEVTLPWGDTNHDPLPWEVQNNENVHTDLFLDKHEPEYPVQVKNDNSENYEHLQETNEETVHQASNEPVVNALLGNDQEDDFFTQIQQESQPNIESQPSQGSLSHDQPAKENPDNLFADEEGDFLEEIGVSDSNLAESKPKLDLDDKLSALDLDDDLLLDEDFLDEAPAPVVSPPVTHAKNHHKSYVPTSNAPRTFSAPPKPEPSPQLKELELKKKKSDFYDFPEALIPSKIRPAARTSSSKYSVTSGSGQSPPIVPPKPNAYAPNTSQESVPPASKFSPQLPKPAPTQGSVSKQNSFFGELPISNKKPVSKPARAAAAHKPVITNPTNANVSPSVQHPPVNRQPPVNPYVPNKPPAQLQLQNQVPIPNSTSYSPRVASSHPSARNTSGYTPANNGQQMAPPSQYAPIPQQQQGFPQPPQQQQGFPQPPQQQQAFPQPPQQQGVFAHQNQQLQPFPNIQGAPVNGNKFSATPINTNVAKTQGANSATSPYVPNAGPYAPSQHQRTHSRASSLVGGKGKEINPYAPALPSVSTSHTIPESYHATPQISRARGFSNAKSNIYAKTQPVPKVLNPNALNQRQFPIFNWSASENIVCLVPNASLSTYNQQDFGIIRVDRASTFLNDRDSVRTFPGPLNKIKTRKKDVEKWVEDNIALKSQSGLNQDEVLLNHVLLNLLKFDGNLKSKDFLRSICAVLNPSVDYFSPNVPDVAGTLAVNANAYRLDNSGVNQVFSLIQTGNIEKALEFSLARGDWAISLVIASFSGPEKFSKIASDYARSTFPFQKSNNKVHHLMPILLKVFAGNVQSVIDDLNAVPVESEYANIHWREIVASIIISESINASAFLIEFGKFLKGRSNADAAEVCFILAGLPLSPTASPNNGVLFSFVESPIYTEIYEYVLSLAPNSAIPSIGLAHLVPLKLKHASTLADYGLFNESQRYLDSINTAIKTLGNRSPFINQVAVQEFQNLYMRITESNSSESGWFSGKISKVNLDKVWGQLDKFIGGDETKPKAGENGVFSKFSPSVSRNASTLDFTALNQSPSVHPGNQYRSESAVSYTGNSLPTDLLALSTSGAAQARADARGSSVSHPPPLNSMNSSSTIQKYAPSIPQKAPLLAHHSSPSPLPNNYEYPGTSRYAASNASSSNLLETNDGSLAPPKRAQSKYAPSQPASNYAFANPIGNVSSSSVNSPAANSLSQVSNYAKRPSVGSILTTESFVHPDDVRVHNHSPSAQSDISIDYPSEFKSSPRKNIDEYTPIVAESPERRRYEHAPILKSPEVAQPKEEPYQNPAKEEVSSKKLDEKDIPPPPLLNRKPTAPRANPYAPGASGSKAPVKRNRYGPPAGSTAKYSVPESISNQFAAPENEGNAFSNGNNPPTFEDEQPHREVEITSTPKPEHSQLREQPVSRVPKEDTQDTATLPPVVSNFIPSPHLQKKVPHLDDSFDLSDVSGSSEIPLPKPTNLFSNQPRIYSPNGRESTINPYQAGNTSISGFSEFPIPGSPESTTRANSVVGGPGLFTSRLSQSHQSAMYQQYEVQDDTVRDYVPVVEEEDEDEEDREAAKEKKKKEDEERKARIEADKVRQKADQAAAQRGQKGGSWFNWLGKDDGKPKPIRAKLGEKVNPFYYDEKHKRWLDRNKPIEEQLKAGLAPPPPPSMKRAKAPASSGPPTPGPSGLAGPPGPGPSLSGPPGRTPSQSPLVSGPPSDTASAPGPARAPPKNLATAGLDDLLSLGSSAGPRTKGKRNPRRGYVSVMEQK